LSTSEHGRPTDFDRWLAAEFAATGGFTALIVLVEIGETQVTPLSSTFLNVIGDDVAWPEMAMLLKGAGRTWDGAAFFPVTDEEAGGPVDNPTARARLEAIAERLDDDRLVLNEGYFFDTAGRRLRIEEVTAH
jgi:hypothetical protein